MKPLENFEGCGSFNGDIRNYVEKEIIGLNGLFKSFSNNKSGKGNLIKAWLIACLMKTLKEQIQKSEHVIDFQD